MAVTKKTRGEEAARRSALFDRLEAMGADGALLNNRNDYHYFSGYTGDDAVLVLSTKKRRGWLVTDSRYTEEAQRTAPDMETVLWRRNFPEFVGKMLRKFRLAAMAYTPASVTVAFFEALKREAGTGAWLDVGPAVSAIRAVKSQAEVAAIATALACAEGAFLASRRRWKIGMTETEIKNDLEWEMRRRGAEDAAFETIVAVGANASLPHAHAGSGEVRAGKMLLVDFGARVNRYNSDLTRTLWAGDIPRAWLRRYKLVLEAQRAGIEAIRAGVPGKGPDAAARRIFARGGAGDHFSHGLGHGAGLAVHEDPRLSPAYARELAPGNVVTVEPGLYYPGAGGIRVEDMVLVEESGARVLSSLPKDPDSILF